MVLEKGNVDMDIYVYISYTCMRRDIVVSMLQRGAAHGQHVWVRSGHYNSPSGNIGLGHLGKK